MANIFTLAHDSWTYQDISWWAPVGQTKGHIQILQDTKRTYLGTSEQMDAYSNSLMYLNDILIQNENHKMQLFNDYSKCRSKCAAQILQFENSRTLSVWKKLHTHRWLCQTCTMSVCQFVTSQSHLRWAGVISIILMQLAGVLNKYQKTFSGDFFFSGWKYQASFTHAGRSSLFSSVFT